MIRVLIAEDEPPIARAITRMVGELSHSFTVAACVSNGRDALEYMRGDPVDVVFTDIRMPVMDGLELLKAVRSEWPDCQVVILSGHQDFSYSQTAIRLGAFDYLLKPISGDNLREMLDRLEDNQAHRLLQEAVGSWRTGGKAPETGISRAKDLSYALVMAIVGQWPTIPDDALSPGAVFWQASDPESAIRELSGDSYETIVFAGRAAAERVFIIGNIQPDKASMLIREMFERLDAGTPLPVTVYAMPGPIEAGDITTAIRTARRQIHSRIGLCRSALLIEAYPGSVPENAPAGAAIPPSQELLTEALCVRGENQIKSAIETLVNAAVSSSMPQIAFEDILEAAIHDRRLSLETKPLKEELGEAISGAASPDGLKDGLTQIFIRYTLGESKTELKARVGQIEKYLSERYSEEISSETLSARFGFVPSYLSKVFRRQTGMSPTEYLTKLRMEKARELLGTNPGLLIRDAAALVGYKDPYYFSKLFKKSTGQWPSQYQEEAAGASAL